MSHRPQTGAPDDRRTVVVALVAQPGRAAVQSDADLQSSVGRPRLGGESALHVERGAQGVGGQCERAHHAVTLTLLLGSHPSVQRDGGIEQLVVASDGGRRPVLIGLPQAGGSLHVAEQERHRARRQGPCSLVALVQWQLATSQLCWLGEGLCHTHVRIVADPRPDDISHMGDMGSRWTKPRWTSHEPGTKPRWTKPHDRCAIADAADSSQSCRSGRSQRLPGL